MPTAGLTGEGLKRYQRWLAVQRAKGIEPNQNEIQSFLQGQIQANIATDIDRQALSLRQGELNNITRRTRLMEKAQDAEAGAATISGISELAKAAGAVNELTGGAITEGLKWGGGKALDWGKSFFSDTGTQSAVDADMWSGFNPSDILSDVVDWSDLF